MLFGDLSSFGIGIWRSTKLAAIKAQIAVSPLFAHNATEADRLKAQTVISNLEGRARLFESSELTQESDPEAIAAELDQWDQEFSVLAAWVQAVQNRQVANVGEGVGGAISKAVTSLGLLGLGAIAIAAAILFRRR